METPRDFPFDKFKVPPSEEAQWAACNPTFHRSVHYSILLTDRALYLGTIFLVFSRSRRISLSDILAISFKDSRWRPSIHIRLRFGAITFRTPHDFYGDEMDFDREKLRRLVQLLSAEVAVAVDG
jgi:hypothetical protein